MTDAPWPAREVYAGRFRVVGPPLGEGASGVVHPAVDLHTGRDVAVKVLHEHLVRDEAALVRLDAEVGVAGRLSHPRVVGVLGLWQHEGRPIVVTERVEGTSLDRLDGPLPPEAVVALGLQLSEALAIAHHAGLVHGDVRPGNVLVGPGGASLFDFGVQGILAKDPGRTGVRPGETAPEVSAGAPPGVASDLYGLGVVLYRGMTGTTPWSEVPPFAALGSQQRCAPRPPEGPRGLRELVTALLDPDPARRPDDAAAVASALRRVQRRPHRRARPAGRWVAPIHPFSAWVVHGTDPATGGHAIVRARLGHGAARQLVARLRAEGWDVAVSKGALSAGDLLWVAALAVLGGGCVPLLGAIGGAVLGLRWRTARSRYRLLEVLPMATAPLPPRPAPGGSEVAVAIGALMWVAAWTLWFEPSLTVVPVALMAVVWGAAGRWRATTEEEVALRARVSTTLADARATVEGRAHGVEHALALHGAIDALEREVTQSGSVDRAVLTRAEALRAGAGAAPRRSEVSTAPTLEALRRSGTTLDR